MPPHGLARADAPEGEPNLAHRLSDTREMPRIGRGRVLGRRPKPPKKLCRFALAALLPLIYPAEPVRFAVSAAAVRTRMRGPT